MMKITVILLLLLASVVCGAAPHSILEGMTITTEPAQKTGEPQAAYSPQTYRQCKLPLHGEGYYSVEGFVNIDSLIKDPALYIGSTIYPIDVYIADRLIYRWGNGKDSKHFADYRSTAVGIDPALRGKQELRIDFWSNGEMMAMPIMKIGERIEMVNTASLISFLNIHFLNGILAAALFITILFGGYYFIGGMKEREILYFSLFSLTLIAALQIFPLNSQQFSEIPLFKAARIGTLFLPFLMLQFVRTYTGVWSRSQMLFWIPLAVTIYTSIQILLTGDGKVGVNRYFDSIGFIILLTEFFIVLMILIKAAAAERKWETILIFAGFLSFITFVVHDIYYLFIGVLPLFWCILYGYALLTLGMLGALMIRQRKAYSALLYYRAEQEKYSTSLEQKVAERTAELQSANEQLKALDSVKSDFVSTISHELRTPLTSVLGFAKIIKKKNSEILYPVIVSDDPRVVKAKQQILDNVDIIISEGERLTNLINDVLDIAKMEAGKIDWRYDSVTPVSIIQRAVSATASLFDRKGIPCRAEIEPALPILSADENRLIQVMINLLSNAVKFTDHGHVVCRAKRYSEGVLFSVTDTGEGIAPENIGAVFEKFKQVGDVLSDKPQGTGLGLPICREIVEHHGGRIWVESEIGKGSSFMFEIPVEYSPARERDPEDQEELVRMVTETVTSEAPISDGKKLVLVVDDEKSIRSLIRQELEDVGYSVAEAEDGLDAMKLTKQLCPDVITLDVMMPNLSGFDLAAVLKNDPATEHIPIILISVIEDRDRGIKIGVDRYFTKPIDSGRLVSAVGELVSDAKQKEGVR